MQHGFIKVAAATCDIRVADVNYNSKEIIKSIKEGAKKGAKLIVFPELCITGCTVGDLFFQPTLKSSASSALLNIALETCGEDIVSVVGLPYETNGKLYNCAAVIKSGKILGLVPKTYIPNYGELCESRYFSPSPEERCKVNLGGQIVDFGGNLLFACDKTEGFILGVIIGEDNMMAGGQALVASGATIIANPSADIETINKAIFRREFIKIHSTGLLCGYIRAGAGEGESTTDLVFSSHNLIYESGRCLAESKRYEAGVEYADIDIQRLLYERCKTNYFKTDKTYEKINFSIKSEETKLCRSFSPTPFVPKGLKALEERCEEILKIQTAGLKKRLLHTKAKKAVIGISGGLDSTLALLVTIRAAAEARLSAKDVLAVTMPCFGTSQRTYKNSCGLCAETGVSFMEVPIKKAVMQHFKDIGHDPNNHDITYENAQARERTQVLMDLANKTGGLVIGTGNMSESALGWATYGGDHISMYAVNGSVPKTLISHIIRHASKTASDSLRRILEDVLDTPVSPELLPLVDGEISQRTEDLVGPYRLHDFFLYYMVRCSMSPGKIYRIALLAFQGEYDGETILKWLKVFYKRFFSQQFKRSCMPDGPKIGTLGLSPRGGWRMPSDGLADLWLSELDKY